MSQFVDDVKKFLRNHRHVTATDVYLLALYYKGDGQPDGDLHGWLIYGDGRGETLACR